MIAIFTKKYILRQYFCKLMQGKRLLTYLLTILGQKRKKNGKKNTQPRTLLAAKPGTLNWGNWGYILREFASDTQWTDKET